MPAPVRRSPSQILETYLRRLKSADLYMERRPIPLEDDERFLECFTLKAGSKLPPGFTRSSGNDSETTQYQYDLRSIKAGRPKAYRVVFLTTPGFDDQTMTVSHLCHHQWCLNPRHVVLESLADNKGRNGCPGPSACQHRARCLRPGPFHKGQSSTTAQLDATAQALLETFKV